MNFFKKNVVLTLLLFATIPLAHTKVVGSWSNVSRHDGVLFPKVDDDNIMQGFSFIQSFSLESGGATTCTFNSRMPVTGDIYLNDGTLFLQQDLIFRNTSRLVTAGKLEGLSHIIEFAESMDEFRLSERVGNEILNIAQAPVSNDEDVNTVAWSHDNQYLVVGTDGQWNAFEMFVYRVEEDSLIDTNASGLGGPSIPSYGFYTWDHPFFGNQRVIDVQWHPSEYYIAAAAVDGDFATNYPYYYDFRVYEFLPTSSRVDAAYPENKEFFPVGVTSVSWHPSGDWITVGTENSSVEIMLYKFNSSTGEIVDGAAYKDSQQAFALPGPQDVGKSCLDWNPSGDYLVAGLSEDASNPELVIYYFNGTTFVTTPTLSIEIGETVSALDWHPTSSLILVGLSGGSERFRLYEIDQDTWTISEKTSGRIGETGTVLSVHWKPDGKKIVMGRKVDGAFDPDDPLTTELRVYDYNPTTQIFSYVQGLNSGIFGPESSPIEINDARWAHEGTRIAVATDGIKRPGGPYFQDNNNFPNTSYTFIYDLLQGTLFSRDLKIYLNSDLYLRTPLSFRGDCLINTRGNKIFIEDNAAIDVRANSVLKFEGGRIRLNKPGVFSLEDQSSKIIFENTTIELGADAFIAQGTLEFDGHVTLKGPYDFSYLSPYTSTIKQNSSLDVTDDATLVLGRIPGQDNQPIVFEDDSSYISFNNGSLSVTNSGWQVTKGNFDIMGGCHFSITETLDSQYGLVLGDGTLENNVTLTIRGGSVFNLQEGCLTLHPYSPGSLLFLGNEAQLSVQDEGKLHVKSNLNLTDGSLFLAPNAELTKDAGVHITTNKTRIHDRYQDFYLTGTLVSIDDLVLDQNDELILCHGNLSKNLTVSRDNNVICGDGVMSGNILFNDQNASLTWQADAKIDEYSMVLNNGIFALRRDLEFYQDLEGFTIGGDVRLSGTLDLDDHVMLISMNDSVWTGSFYILANDSSMEFQAKVSLSGTWTIDGTHTIDGGGKMMELLPTANIFVAPNSRLTLRNMVLKNLSGTKLSCRADNAQIIFDNVLIIQDNDYKFETGSLLFRDDVHLIGGAGCSDDTIFSFSYESSQSSLIDANSTFHILRGIRFEVGNKLNFTDWTSVLHLDDTILRVIDNGLQLESGRMRISNSSLLDIDTTYGVSLGDGSVDINDFSIEIEGDAQLAIDSGKLYYNNVSAEDKIVFIDTPATLRINYLDGLTASRNLLLKNGTLNFPTVNYLETLGSAVIDQEYMWHVHDVPYSRYFVQARFQSGLGYLLVDDGFISVMAGRVTIPLEFDSGMSVFGGMGVVQSTLALRDHNTMLLMTLESDLNSDIIMNGGTLNLATHLNFVGSKTLTGSGKVILNDNRFGFGTDAVTLDHEIYWDMSSAVNLGAKTSLSGTWTFGGTGNLNGHGNILDLSLGGTIFIDNDATLYMTDVVIKGLGDTNGGSILFGNNNSTVHMSNVSVVLTSNYTVAIGGIYVEGPTVWYLDNFSWTFDTLGSLTVDGTVLWWDLLDKNLFGKITFASPTANHLSLLNSGTIKGRVVEGIVTSGITNLSDDIDNINLDTDLLFTYFSTIDHGPYDYSFDSPPTMTYNIYLGPSHKMFLREDMTYNGSSWYIHFSRANEPLLFVDPGKTVTLVNVVLKDFHPDYVSYGDQNSNLVFGGGTTIEFIEDFTLTRQWTFTGDAKVKGFKTKVTLGSGGIIDVYDGSSLTLEDVSIAGLSSITNNLRCRANDASFVLKDSELMLSSDYAFNVGSMSFAHEVKLTGTNTFAYATSMTSTIIGESLLYVDHGVTFKYDPPIANRNLFVMTDTTSKLHLNGCVLRSTPTGLRLTRGMILFDNYVTVSAEGLTRSEAIFLDDAILMPEGGAYVETYGYVDMN